MLTILTNENKHSYEIQFYRLIHIFELYKFLELQCTCRLQNTRTLEDVGTVHLDWVLCHMWLLMTNDAGWWSRWNKKDKIPYLLDWERLWLLEAPNVINRLKRKHFWYHHCWPFHFGGQPETPNRMGPYHLHFRQGSQTDHWSWSDWLCTSNNIILFGY